MQLHQVRQGLRLNRAVMDVQVLQACHQSEECGGSGDGVFPIAKLYLGELCRQLPLLSSQATLQQAA